MTQQAAVIAQEIRELLNAPYVFEIVDHAQIRREARQYATRLMAFVTVCVISVVSAVYMIRRNDFGEPRCECKECGKVFYESADIWQSQLCNECVELEEVSSKTKDAR